MEAFIRMVNQQMVLFIYLVVGAYAKKRQIITKEVQGKFIDFILFVAMPCMVFQSFNRPLTLELVRQMGVLLLVAFGICIVAMLLGRVIYNRYPEEKRNIMRYATLVNNAGFAGLPMAEGVYGDIGTFYASIAILPNRIFMWSAGISLFQKADMKTMVKNVMLNPNIIAIYLGLFRSFLNFSLPSFLDKALNGIGGIVAPLSMVVVGAILADVPIRSVLEKGVLYLSFVRLILLPVLAAAILKFIGAEPVTAGVSLILTSMPAGTSTALLAAKYGADTEFASKCVFVTTVLSLITVPLMMFLI